MKNIYTIIWAAMIAMSSSLLLACSDDDDAPAPLAVNFTNTTASLANDIEELEVSITFSRAVPEAGSLTIAIESDGLTYGQDNDFFTAPLAENGQLVLPYQANAQSVSFKILKGAPKIIGDDGKAKFNIQLGSESNLAVGSNATFEISFSDDFVAERGTVELNGGIGFVNQAFLDFSKLTSSQVDAGSWDLGFYTEAGEFYVILNGSTGMMARPLDVNSLTMVSATDTTGFATEMITGFRVTSPMNATWTDDPDGDLEDTAFGEIAEMDSDNQVFIVKDAEGTFWKKVRVLRNGENYTLQYANIADSKIEEVAITKNDQFDFVYFSFSNGITQAAPAKDDWDIRYSEYTEHARLPIGETSILVPYLVKDFIAINHLNGVETVLVEETDDLTFESFSAANVQDLEFSDDANAMGISWRKSGGPDGPPAVFPDKFTVLRDTDGNLYKIKFNRLTSVAEQERGFPELTFEKL